MLELERMLHGSDVKLQKPGLLWGDQQPKCRTVLLNLRSSMPSISGLSPISLIYIMHMSLMTSWKWQCLLTSIFIASEKIDVRPKLNS